jgi:hypothetical protein
VMAKSPGRNTNNLESQKWGIIGQSNMKIVCAGGY